MFKHTDNLWCVVYSPFCRLRMCVVFTSHHNYFALQNGEFAKAMEYVGKALELGNSFHRFNR